MYDANIPPDLASIRFLSGPLVGQTFPIRKPSVTLGRDGTNDIVVRGDQKVSRTHARLFLHNGAWSIEKLAPQNILGVNQQPVQQAMITHNTTIYLGEDSSFLFLTMSAIIPSPRPTPPPPPASLQPQPPRPMWVPGGRPDETQLVYNRPLLEVSSNIHGARQSYPLMQDVTNIGRDGSNDICIKDGGIISSHHLQIIRQNGQYVLIHPHPDRPKTLNGLFYQGHKINGDEPFRKVLTNGDIFRIGDENGTFVTLTYNDGTGVQAEEALPPVQPIHLNTREITIGRRQDNTVVLAHPQVSAYHARMVQEGGTYRILDLNSTNRTYVNSERVTNCLLKLGDEIRIGPYRLVYEMNQLTQYDETNFIRIDAIDLKKTGNKGVPLLSDISISIPPRKFVALVGGSGAGKSTLMDALNGLRPAQQGKVLYNGQDYYRNLAAFSTQLGYVPQEDIVHRDLTVDRALYYAAKMRLPDDFTDAQIKQRINEVLEDVEMTNRRKLLVSKLSGGQRKRVSIALELLANPSLFFLDEPTSGLDPGLDRKMMFLLRKLADKGHTIILVTHATNNINNCDYVCFLVKDGRVAYFGPPEEAKHYFGKTDFAEIYTSLEPTDDNPNVPAEAQAHFRSSGDYQKYVFEPLQTANSSSTARNGHLPITQIKARKRGNALKQFVLLSMRYLELLKNDKATLTILLLQAPIIGLLIMFMVYFELGFGRDVFSAGNVRFAGQGAQTVLFILSFATVLFGTINGYREIVKEAAIYRRERTVNLGIMPYMFSKLAVLGILSIVQSLILLLVTDLIEPLHQGVFLPVNAEVLITFVLSSLAGLLLGLTISALSSNNDSATSFIPLVLLPQVVFAGVIIPLKDWPLQVLAMLFPTRWAVIALSSSVGIDNKALLSNPKTNNYDRLILDTVSYHGTLLPTFSTAEATRYMLITWGSLIAIILLLLVAIGMALKAKDVRK